MADGVMCEYCKEQFTTNNDFICDECHQHQAEYEGSLPEPTEKELREMMEEMQEATK